MTITAPAWSSITPLPPDVTAARPGGPAPADEPASELLRALAICQRDRLVERTLQIYCAVDQEGKVVDANARMREIIPDCMGRHLADCFTDGADLIRAALAGTTTQRVQGSAFGSGDRRRPVLAEIAPPDAVAGRVGYALLVDLSGFAAAERQAFEAAPYGVLRLDPDFCVREANDKAVQIFGGPRAELIGRDARSFVITEDNHAEVMRRSRERLGGRGDQFPLLFTQPHTGRKINLRVTSIPQFDCDGAVSSILTTIEDVDIDVAREAIHAVAATQTEPLALLAGVMDTIAGLIPFDLAGLSIYSDDGTLTRALYIHPAPERPYQTRWFVLPEALRKFISQPDTHIDDYAEFYARMDGGEEFMQEPTVQQFLSQGYKAGVSVPVRDGKRLIGALWLSSRTRAAYNNGTNKILDQLGVAKLLLAVFHAHERDQHDFTYRLLKAISASDNHEELAQTVVDHLAQFYRYQNVSIFKVNVLSGYFSLLAQQSGPAEGFRIPAGYTQPLDRGLLGRAYHSGAPVILAARDDPDDEVARCFKAVAPETMSELCLPVRLRGRILWILNLEDRQRSAFAQPEVSTLQRIIAELEATLDRLFRSLVLSQVLEVAPDPIVITRVDGEILDCSDNALDLFECETVPRHQNLGRFLPDPHAAAAARDRTTAALLTKVRGDDGRETPVLLTSLTLPEEYDHRVVVLKNIGEEQWQFDFQVVSAALAEAAAQVRVPLSLAFSFARQVARKAQDSDLIELADKLIRQLGKVELTYDRVMASYAPDNIPPERPVAMDLRDLVDQVLAELPVNDRNSTQYAVPAQPMLVVARPFQMAFLLQSMLAYLLRCRITDDPVNIRLHTNASNMVVEMTGPGRESRLPQSDLGRTLESTRTEIALAESSLRRIVSEHGGTFERHLRPDRMQVLEARLPAMPDRRKSRGGNHAKRHRHRE
jgi:PAS domain S-box-containing protein